MHLRCFIAFIGIFLLGRIFCLDAAPMPPAPSAGIIERQIEQEYEAKPFEMDKDIPSIQIDIPKERLDLPEDKKVQISHIHIQGNQVLSEMEIVCCLGDFLDQTLSIKDIYEICHRIEQCYARQGYFLARAYPPVQTIDKGILTIEVLEGILGSVEVEGNQHYSTEFILKFFASIKGKPLQYDEFLRALMVLNDMHDLSASAVFKKGTTVGTADLVIRVQDQKAFHLYLNGNNYGRWLTTNSRGGGRLDIGNILAYGDQLSVAEVIGFPVDALYFTDAIYSIPLTKRGLIAELAYLTSRFHVQEMQPLHLKGSSKIATAKLTQAFYRTRSFSVDGYTYFDYKQIQNFTLSRRTSYDRLRNLNVGATFDFYRPSYGREFLRLQATLGIPDIMGGMKAVSSGCSRIGGGGRFVKINADLDFLQKLRRQYSAVFYAHVSGQWSPYKLTSPEQMYIGGVDTVRGFPLAVAVGDSGYYANFELRIPPLFRLKTSLNNPINNRVQIVLFSDQGAALLHDGVNQFYCSAGVGLRLNQIWKFSVAFDMGVPLNHRAVTNNIFWYLRIAGQMF